MEWPKQWIPSRRWLFLPPILIGLLVVVSLVMARQELQRVPAEEVAQPLRVVRATTSDVAPEATGYGTARPLRIWTAVAEVGGRVVEAHPDLRPGVYVERGETLLRIDDQDYKLREKQRRADLAQARAQAEQLALSQEADRQSLAIQEQLLAVRQTDVDRLAKLRDTSAASASEADVARGLWLTQMQAVQTLKNSLSLYPSQISSAEATIEFAESRLAEATRDVERTSIKAPFAGVLSGVRLEPNQYVMPSERLFEVHDVHSVEIESQFSLSQLSRLIPSLSQPRDVEVSAARQVHSIHAGGLSANVTTRSGNLTIEYVGHPVRVREAIDDQTRTLGIVVRVANHVARSSRPQQPQTLDDSQSVSTTVPIPQGPRMPLRPGTYCEVKLVRKLTVEGILVPRTAIEDDAVFVVDDKNRVRWRSVQVGFAVADQVAIVQGLKDGDLVAVKPPASLTDGRLVKPEVVPPITDDLLSSRGVSETR